jgi:hypothetical protein
MQRAGKGIRKEDYVLPWLRPMVKQDRSGSTSSLRVWRRVRPFASACQSTPPLHSNNACRFPNADASLTTTSTYAMNSARQWSYGWRDSSPSKPPTTSTAIPSSRGNKSGATLAFAKMTVPFLAVEASARRHQSSQPTGHSAMAGLLDCGLCAPQSFLCANAGKLSLALRISKAAAPTESRKVTILCSS